MTIEDSLRDLMAAKVADPPELPGLYGDVAARAVVVRRRRRVAAAVSSAVAVIAIAVPISLTVQGSRHPGPGAPTLGPSPTTTARALPLPTTTPAGGPSGTVTPAPSGPSTRASAGPTEVTDSTGVLVESPPAAPEAPTLSLPRGGSFAAPVVEVDGKQLSLLDKGVSYVLGSQGTDFEYPSATPYGVLLPGPDGVRLVDSRHQLVVLPDSRGTNGCGGLLVSHDGRYVAWGAQGGPGGTAGGEPTLKGTYVLYDLAARKVVQRYSAQAQACPQAFTTDGRVLMSMGDGAATDAGFWDPPAGTVTLVGKGTTATLWTSRTHAEKVLVKLDDNGGCAYYRPGVTGGKAYLGYCGTDLGSPTSQQERISAALSHDHLAVSDLTLLDATHVGVIGSTQGSAQGFTFTYSWLLTCTVPAQGSVTCLQNQQLAPQWSADSGPDKDVQRGPRVFLVR